MTAVILNENFCFTTRVYESNSRTSHVQRKVGSLLLNSSLLSAEAAALTFEEEASGREQEGQDNKAFSGRKPEGRACKINMLLGNIMNSSYHFSVRNGFCISWDVVNILFIYYN